MKRRSFIRNFFAGVASIPVLASKGKPSEDKPDVASFDKDGFTIMWNDKSDYKPKMFYYFADGKVNEVPLKDIMK